MHVLLGLAFIGGGIAAPVYYVRCLLEREFPGGRRRSYLPITRENEPIRYWLCAAMFGVFTLVALSLGVGLGLAAIFSSR